MAHYAFLDENNLVTEVIVGIDENELIDGLTPEVWYSQFRRQACLRTSYNHKIRKQYAGIGFTYDPIKDIFIAPQPYPSWVLDANDDWIAPIAKPEGDYIWNEIDGKWDSLDEL